MQPLESKIKKEIRLQLEQAGWYVVYLVSTNKNGIPDIIAHRRKKTIYIEAKREGRGREPLQEFRAKELRQHGIPSYFIENTEQLKTNKLI